MSHPLLVQIVFGLLFAGLAFNLMIAVSIAWRGIRKPRKS